jgi:hypothetical protein
MIAIKKATLRKTETTYRDRSKLRPLVVSIEPGDLLGFRYLGTRKTYRLPIGVVANMAIRAFADSEARRKAAERKARRGLA